jgi:hypothetical protein
LKGGKFEKRKKSPKLVAVVKPHHIPSSTDLVIGDVKGDWQEVRIIKWMSYRSVISRGQDPLEC